jgi:hypothetical protein
MQAEWIATAAKLTALEGKARQRHDVEGQM